MDRDLQRFPGGSLVVKGLADLDLGLRTQEALLVLVAATRLRNLGFEIPGTLVVTGYPEHALYTLIEGEEGRGAHSAYNALIQKIVSFAQAYEQFGRN